MVPRTICRRWRMRQVWKPFEWAEMPRIAYIETGRPTMRSWNRPAHHRIEDERIALPVAREEAVIGFPVIADDEPRRIGIAGEIVEIGPFVLQKLMDEGAGEQPVGARTDADPFIGDRRIAGAHRVDGNDLDPALLELAKTDLDWVRGMVLGDAEQHEIFGVLPVGLAELPERAAEAVEA